MMIKEAHTSIVADGESVIPYTVWGNAKKVVLRGETELKFHDTTYEAIPNAVPRTTWVNFNFENEKGRAESESTRRHKLTV